MGADHVVAGVEQQAALVLAEAHHFYIAIDEAGDVLAWNGAAERVFGWTADEALGRSAHDLIIPASSRAAHLAGLERFRVTGHGRGIDRPVEVEALTREGGTVTVELGIRAVEGPGGWTFHVLGSDVSARRAQERVLNLVADHRQGLLRSADADEVRALLCETAREVGQADGAYLYELLDRRRRPEGSTAVVLVAEARGLAGPGSEVVDLGPRTLELLARDGRVVLPSIPDAPRGEAADLRSAGLRSAVVEGLQSEDGLVGVLVLGWMGPRPLPDEADQRLLGLLASEATLVVERLALQERLTQAARTDALTGLLNRRAFAEGVDRALARAQADGTPVVLCMLDLDGFKAFNDTHGHPAGDAHLQAVAAAWRCALAGSPTELYRFGGDEFALVLRADAVAAREVVLRLAAATPGPTGVTAGCALARPGEDAAQLLVRADAELYARKRARPGASAS